MSKQPHLEQPATTFNELLINEVKSHPQLYDQQHRVCTDNGERNLIWDMIAQRIDPAINGEFAKKRWLQMRDRYRKELKMAIRTTITPKWPYFSKLSWLDSYLKDAKSIKAEAATPLVTEIVHAKTDFSSLRFLSPDKEQAAKQHLQLPQLQTVNLLEQLMAASRELLERQRDKMVCATETDSQQQMENSILDDATTSEDGGEQQQCQQNSFPSKASDEVGDNGTEKGTSLVSDGGCEEMQHHQSLQCEDRFASLTQLINHRLVNSAPASFLLENTPSPFSAQMDVQQVAAPLIRMDGSSPIGFSKNNRTPITDTQQQRQPRSRNQPPYLVRRGNKHQQKGHPKTPVESSMTMAATTPKPELESVGTVESGNATEITTMLHHENQQMVGVEEWTRLDMNNDEDLLFARLVVARMKKYDTKKRREIRFSIHQFLDKTEEDMEILVEQQGEELQQEEEESAHIE